MTEYTVEQQKANRDKWVAALRSGEFQQGKTVLRTVDDRFCCLGVACELAHREGVIGYTDDEYHHREYDGNDASLTRDMQAWLGLADDVGEISERVRFVASDGNPDIADALTELNDKAGYTFAQIADLIENDGVKVRS